MRILPFPSSQVWTIYAGLLHFLFKSNSASSYQLKIIFIIANTKWWYQCSKHVIHTVVFCLFPVFGNTFLLKYVYVTRSVYRTFRRNNIYRLLLDFIGLFSLFLIDCLFLVLSFSRLISWLFMLQNFVKYMGSQKCYQVPRKLESKLIFTTMVFILFLHSKNIPRFKIMCIVDRHRSSQRTVDVWPRKIKTNLHLVTWSVFA